MNHTILLVDDELGVLQSLRILLEERGYCVESAHLGADAVSRVARSPLRYSVVVVDYGLPDLNGKEVIEQIRRAGSEALVIVYSGDESFQAMQSTWRAGAIAFFEKGEPVGPLLEKIEQYFPSQPALEEGPTERLQLVASIGMVGWSTSMAEVARRVLRYREIGQNVMVFGETGTGKELVARALGRPGEKFFAVNCAAYRGNSDLLESELFGYEKGAFTGASKERKGIFETAGGGTVFLDEIHHLSMAAQAKLLRVCQERAIRRVGGTREYPVRCRLVTAAKADLEARSARGEFLPDLFHRLDVLHVSIPPLRERPEDVQPLVEYFCRTFATETGELRSFTPGALRRLESFPWPGNVRELQNALFQLLTDRPEAALGEESLKGRFSETSESGPSALSYQEFKEQQQTEQRELILRVLRDSPNKIHAARRLQISPTTLHSLMHRLQIPDPSLRSRSRSLIQR